MTSFISFIESYGYLAVFVGSIFEGESVVLIGGLSSHEEYLSFVGVVFFAFLGALVGDWSFFFLGRKKNVWLFDRFPAIARLLNKPTILVEKKPRFISFSMRFMYGFRHIIPLSIGKSRIPAKQFLLWNCFGAICWAIIVTTAGYLAGDVLETFFGDIKRYEFRIIIFTIIVIALFSAIARVVRIFLLQSKYIEKVSNDSHTDGPTM
ncbi:MAG TPA: DedA family protein [Candidatus Paceibacterota bacterium]|nr:DedA family protein [Candidatus Paceibacterota bacterium]HMO82579.1 DedA family protein [Candidatus Paceibacterota bacterium]